MKEVKVAKKGTIIDQKGGNECADSIPIIQIK